MSPGEGKEGEGEGDEVKPDRPRLVKKGQWKFHGWGLVCNKKINDFSMLT